MKHIRLLGLATDESKVSYRLWANRGIRCDEVPNTATALAVPDKALYFGWTGAPKRTNGHGSFGAAEFLGIECKEGLEKLYAQDLYGWFMFSLVDVIKEVCGSTTRRSNDPASATVFDAQSNG